MRLGSDALQSMWEALPCGDHISMMTSEPTSEPHSKALCAHRSLEVGATFFVTKCLLPRRPLLITTGIVDEIVTTLRFSVEKKKILLAAFVVMPDHWHALISAIPPLTLPMAMHRIDGWIGRSSVLALETEDVHRQDGYHDTRIRSSKQFRYVMNYIESNPVEKGLVAKADAWRWSSANPEHRAILTRPWPWTFEQDHA